MNLNPIASGNKTQSGVGGLLTIIVGGAVAYGLKAAGLTDDQTAAIAGVITSATVSGILTVIGIIHKKIKGEK